MKIELAEPNEHWGKAFEDEQAFLSSIFHDEINAIEHIGSTSIPKVNAKPIIDIFLALTPFREVSFYKKKLDFTFYKHVPTGMINRYLFAKYDQQNTWTHNIHLLPFDDEFHLRNELLFRDYLRSNTEYVLEYNELKKQLAGKHHESLDDYTKQKTQFIQKIVDLARAEKELPRQNVWTMKYIKDHEKPIFE